MAGPPWSNQSHVDSLHSVGYRLLTGHIISNSDAKSATLKSACRSRSHSSQPNPHPVPPSNERKRRSSYISFKADLLTIGVSHPLRSADYQVKWEQMASGQCADRWQLVFHALIVPATPCASLEQNSLSTRTDHHKDSPLATAWDKVNQPHSNRLSGQPVHISTPPSAPHPSILRALDLRFLIVIIKYLSYKRENRSLLAVSTYRS